MSSSHRFYSALLVTLLGVSLGACATRVPALLPAMTVSLPDRGGTTPLEDAVIYGEVVITAESEGVREASLYLDDGAATGTPLLTVTTSPITLTLETRTLPDGPHSLTLKLLAQDGEVSLSQLPFTVGNEAYAMLRGVNALRARGYDCGAKGTFGSAPALRLEPRLLRAAQRQADDMHTNGFFGHTGSDGSTVATRVDDTGYRWSRVGENVAKGQETVAKVVSDWAESDGHCANLLNPDFSELGVGRAGSYWVQVFARP